MSGTTIQPALTAEQWANVRRVLDRPGASPEHRYPFIGKAYTDDNLPALAALCLYGQPFGFSWEDVDELRSWPMCYETGYDIPKIIESLADRIAALLPPREDL